MIAYRAHAIEEHVIRSRVVAQAFRVKVLSPISHSDGLEQFPVVYATDSDDFFGAFAAMAATLQFHGETPRFILVGIGYDEPQAAGLLRMRDFYTHGTRALFRTEIEQFASSPIDHGLVDLTAVMGTTGALEFLQFICEELIPFIAGHYSVSVNDNSYFGYSSGGAFGLYTLFTRPTTFKRYILGSPATSHGGHNFGLELARAFLASGQGLNAKVFMSVGELEEFKRGLCQFDLVTGCYLLAKFLRQVAPPGLDLTFRVLPGETHATAWALAFAHGLKTLFGPVGDVPFWPEFYQTGLE